MKRANGTGSIVRLSGRRRRPWAVRISCRGEDGRTVQRLISYHARASDAQDALEDYNRRTPRGIGPVSDMTVEQVFNGWSSREYRKLNKGSIASHNAAWRKRVSRFAGRKMRSVTLDEWQSILDEDERAGLCRSVIMNDAILIKALNRYAMERDIIAKDYSAYLDIPQAEVKCPRGALTEPQLRKLKQLAQEGAPYADTALMLCYTGFRINEFLSLTAQSYHPKGDYLQGGLKTQAGRERIVPVHPQIAPYLAAWLARGGETIVCRDDGRPMRDTAYRRHFAELMARIGAEGATPHCCRHTFATRLHAAGVDPITVKWLMGHSTKADITAHYTHKTLAVLRRGIQRLS